jgi:transposase
MLIVGCDHHPSFQQIAWVDTESGECGERPLMHSTGEAERFYRNLKEQGVKVRVGIEATGHSRWFERLLTELEYELWVGDAAEIKAKRVRKQKNDREDARLLRTLLVENRFPRVWLADQLNRDLRQLLWHRHRLVQMRTRVMNQLQALALNEGVQRKKGLWSQAGRAQLESFQLLPWATRRREDLLKLLDGLTPRIQALTADVNKQAEQYPEARRLMTHPGVGPLTALAYVLIIGSPDRFRCGKQIGCYLGLIPSEESSANRQRLGHITKQGNSLLRFLLLEAAQAAVRSDADWRREFLHLTMRRGRQIAVVALARKLAVGLYWMWRNGRDYEKSLKFSSHVGQPGTGYGVK